MIFWDYDGVDSESPLNIVLPDNMEDYSVSSPDAYDYSLKYPDAFLLVQSAGAESASFERGGTVKLAHNTGSHKLTSTLDSATGISTRLASRAPTVATSNCEGPRAAMSSRRTPSRGPRLRLAAMT